MTTTAKDYSVVSSTGLMIFTNLSRTDALELQAHRDGDWHALPTRIAESASRIRKEYLEAAKRDALRRLEIRMADQMFVCYDDATKDRAGLA